MKNRIIPIEKLESLIWKPGDILPDIKPPAGRSDGSGSEIRLEKVSDGYVFHNLAGIGSVKLLNDYLDSDSSKKHDDWRTHCAGRSDGIVVPNSIVLYQMARALYELRNDSNYQEIVKECQDLFNEDWTKKYPHTGTKVIYGAGLGAVVDSLQLDGSTKKNNLEIPEFTKANEDWSYFVLAPEQAETNLGSINPIPDNAKPVLQELLGEGYEQAGEIFQYFSPRRNGNLREIRLWIPTLIKRNSERAVVFGVNYIGNNFSINANDSVSSRPSRGVVAVRENSP
ncbi:hypothetical protein HZA97_07195 [Candidatus Woesearchaeota archaeon]|nr:hypothetical protein [Candidatus Woesearchaeota archaeon]